MEKYRLMIYRIAAFLAFLFCMFLIQEGIRFLIVDDIKSETRITLHEMYEQESIDVLFLGSSHCYRSLIPSILDEQWGVNTFNAGTSSQQTSGSYHLLREVGKRTGLKKVYLDIYYDLMGDNKAYQTSTNTYIISDYMKPSLNRLQLLWNAGGKDYMVHGLILGRRYWEKLLDQTYIRDLLREKCNREYLNYEYITTGNDVYAGKGYVSNSEVISDEEWAVSDYEAIPDKLISDKNKEYLDKIISYCKKKNIELVFYSAPMTDSRLMNVGNYDSFIEQMEDFLNGKGIEYFDFNLCRKEFLDLDRTCFMDNHHLNEKGAEMFTRAFADYFSGRVSPDRAFWKSYREKMENQNWE